KSETYFIKELILGTPVIIDTTVEFLSENFKPTRIVINAPCPGFGIIEQLRFGNGFPIGLPGDPKETLSSDACPFGQEDMYTYNAGALGITLDLPKLKKGDPITIKGVYTGVVPQG